MWGLHISSIWDRHKCLLVYTSINIRYNVWLLILLNQLNDHVGWFSVLIVRVDLSRLNHMTNTIPSHVTIHPSHDSIIPYEPREVSWPRFGFAISKYDDIIIVPEISAAGKASSATRNFQVIGETRDYVIGWMRKEIMKLCPEGRTPLCGATVMLWYVQPIT